MSKIDICMFYGYFHGMGQMNVSVTDRLAGFVRKKVRAGQYNSASEVVREALRRMEEDDARALRLAKPAAEDLLADLDREQVDAIRRRVHGGLADIASGRFREIGQAGELRGFAESIKAKGRELLAIPARTRRLAKRGTRKA